jgi:putative ABC transport system permease protein
MFWTFVLRAVQFRKRRLTLAFAALAVSATLATALFSVYSDIERKMRVQFRGFGANIVIAPSGGEETVPLTAVALAERQGAVAAPFIYSVGRVEGEPAPLPITGAWMARAPRGRGNAWWAPTWPRTSA